MPDVGREQAALALLLMLRQQQLSGAAALKAARRCVDSPADLQQVVNMAEKAAAAAPAEVDKNFEGWPG